MIDIASCRVVAYAKALHLRTELISGALANAMAARIQGRAWSSIPTALPAHLGRYAALARENQAVLSVRRTGQCWDNILRELLLHVDGRAYRHERLADEGRARRAVVNYIARYNGTWLYFSFGYRSPADYENDHHANHRPVA